MSITSCASVNYSPRSLVNGFLCSAVLLIVSAFGANSALAQAQEQTPPPAILEGGDHVDLGELAPRESATRELRLINNSDKTLRFERATGSCSCITGTVSPDPVAPGEAATVTVTMEAIINDGVQEKSLYVFAEGYRPPYTIKVTAKVVDPSPIEDTIAIEPAELNAGYIKPGEPVFHEVLLRNKGEEPIQFARVSTTCTCVQGELLDDLVEPGEAARLKVRIEGKDIGPVAQKLTVWFIGASRPLQVPVKAEVSLAVKADPFYINLAAPPAQGQEIPLSGTITLTSIDNRPFRVLSAGGKPATLDSANEPALKHVVHWDFHNVPDDQIQPWWLIETDHPEAPVLDIRVIHMALLRQMVASQGPWTLAPDRMVIGQLQPGAAEERTFRLLKVKSDDIKSVSVDSPLLDVELVGVEKTAAGAEATIRISAAPEAKGLIRTKLHVQADGVDQSSYLFVRIGS